MGAQFTPIINLSETGEAAAEIAVNKKNDKDAVLTVADINITLSGFQTLKGYLTQDGDRVGVVGQTNKAQNGIYIAHSGAWLRSSDADSSEKVTPGMSFNVANTNSTRNGYRYTLCTIGTIVLNTTLLVFDGFFPSLGGGSHINLFPWNYDAIQQGTWHTENNANQFFDNIFRNTTNAQNDSFSHKVYMQKGTYTWKILYMRNTILGKLHLDIDGVPTAIFDMYGSSGNNNKGSVTSIVVAESGLKTLRFYMATTSGAGYQCYLNLLTFFRTA